MKRRTFTGFRVSKVHKRKEEFATHKNNIENKRKDKGTKKISNNIEICKAVR